MGKASQLISARNEETLRRLGLGDDAIRFYKHPWVVNRACRHGYGGFSHQGDRLVGVHFFLQQRYYPNFKATRKASVRGAHNKRAGQLAGSKADAQLTRYINDKWVGGPRGKMKPYGAAANLLNYMLGPCALDVLDAHVLVFDPVWKVATEIDILAQTRSANPTLFVIENKTTLQTRAEHLQTYFMADRGFPVLRGSLQSERNSEYTHHQLQLAVMVSMLRRQYGLQHPVDGAVLMRVKGGSVLRYPLQQEFVVRLEADMAIPDTLPPPRPMLSRAYVPYIMNVVPPAKHALLDALLRDQAAADPLVEAMRQQWREFLTKHYHGATVTYNVLLGHLPIQGRTLEQAPMAVDVRIHYMGLDTLVLLKVALHCTAGTLRRQLQQGGRVPKLLPNGRPHTLKNLYALEVGARWVLDPTARKAHVVVLTPHEYMALPVLAKFKDPFLM